MVIPYKYGYIWKICVCHCLHFIIGELVIQSYNSENVLFWKLRARDISYLSMHVAAWQTQKFKIEYLIWLPLIFRPLKIGVFARFVVPFCVGKLRGFYLIFSVKHFTNKLFKKQVIVGRVRRISRWFPFLVHWWLFQRHPSAFLVAVFSRLERRCDVWSWNVQVFASQPQRIVDVFLSFVRSSSPKSLPSAEQRLVFLHAGLYWKPSRVFVFSLPLWTPFSLKKQNTIFT